MYTIEYEKLHVSLTVMQSPLISTENDTSHWRAHLESRFVKSFHTQKE